MSIKILFTASLLLASVTVTTASNLYNIFRGVESNDTKGNSAGPVSKPSTNHSEKSTNAKFMAKQLLKSASANVILGKTSDILERYGYHTSVSGTFFSNANTSNVASQTQPFAIISMSNNDRGDVVSVKVESNKDLQVFLNTESGLEVPFELMNLGTNQVFISPSYVLPNGNYIIGLKTKKDEVKLNLVVEKRELLGKK